MKIRELIEHAKAEEHVTATQLALLVQCDPEVIRRMVRQGKLPALRIGGRVRLHRETVLRLLASRRLVDATECDGMRREMVMQ